MDKNIVYGDESGFAYSMPRTHGYTPKGQKCYGVKEFGNKNRTNAIGALYNGNLICVGLFNCNIDTSLYTQWIKDELLDQLPDNSVYIIDNASFHKESEIRPLLEARGHILLYLPPYSPEYNKIENKWAQAKHYKRKYRCDVDTLFQQYM